MEKLSIEELQKGQGFASNELREELIERIKENNIDHDSLIVNLAYTDYGGEFFDKVAIEYFVKHYPENIIVEDTCYFGENAFLFGNVANEFWKNNEDSFLSFEDIESYYLARISEEERKEFELFLNDIKDKYIFNMDNALEYLIQEKGGYYSIYSWGLDISYENLENELLKENIIFSMDDDILSVLINEGVPANIAKYYQSCYNNGTMQENLMPERIISIIKNAKA